MSQIYGKLFGLFGRENVKPRGYMSTDTLPADATTQADLEDDFDYIPVLPASLVALEKRTLETRTKELSQKIELERNSSLDIVKKTIEEFSISSSQLKDLENKCSDISKLKLTDFNPTYLAEVINFYDRGLMHRLSKLVTKPGKNHPAELTVNPFMISEGRFCIADLIDYQRYLSSTLSHLILSYAYNQTSDKNSRELVSVYLTRITIYLIKLAYMLLYNFKDLNGFAGVALALLHPAVKRVLDRHAQLPSHYVSMMKDFASFLSPKDNYSIYFLQFHKISLSETLSNREFELKNSPFPEVPWMVPYAFKLDTILTSYSSTLPSITEDYLRPNLTLPGQKRLDFLLETLSPFALPSPKKNPHPLLSDWLLSLPYLSQDNLWKASDLVLSIPPSFLKFLKYPLASSFPYRPLGSYKPSTSDSFVLLSASEVNSETEPVPTILEGYGIVAMPTKAGSKLSSLELLPDLKSIGPEESWIVPSGDDPSPFPTLDASSVGLFKEIETQNSYSEDSVKSFDPNKLMDSILNPDPTDTLTASLNLSPDGFKDPEELNDDDIPDAHLVSHDEVPLSPSTVSSHQEEGTKSPQSSINRNDDSPTSPVIDEMVRISFACPDLGKTKSSLHLFRNEKPLHKRAISYDVSLMFGGSPNGGAGGELGNRNSSVRKYLSGPNSTDAGDLWLPPIAPLGNILDAFSPNEKTLLSPTNLIPEEVEEELSNAAPHTSPVKTTPRRRFQNRHSRTRSDFHTYNKFKRNLQNSQKEPEYEFKEVGTATTADQTAYPIIKVEGIGFTDDSLKSASSPSRSTSELWDAGCATMGLDDSPSLDFIPALEDDHDDEFDQHFYYSEVCAK